MKEIDWGTSFKKDFKRVNKQSEFRKKDYEFVLQELREGRMPPAKYKPHRMTASGVIYQGFWNFHVQPNLILICDIRPDTIYLVRIGSHNELGLTESLSENN